MKQLLEALDLAQEALQTLMIQRGSIYDKAITAIQQARSAPVQEQIAALIDENQRLRAELKFNTLPAAPVQELTNLQRHEQNVQKFLVAQPAPVQEPDHGDELTIAYMSGLHDGKKKREWVGLTDEEIKRIGKLDLDSDYFGLWYDFAKAIEAKLKEKNNG